MILPRTFTNPAVSQGIAWSAAAHVLILFALSLTVPVQAISSNPQFTFLGSILKIQELTPVAFKKTESHPLNFYSFEENGHLSQQSPYRDLRTTKPPSAMASSQQKKTFKSTFLPQEAAQHQNEEDLGIDVQLPVYQSIRTKTND
ncbi:MAG: hypothetical protein Q7S13_06540 [Candidatus Omnitrophota bacterium]|nr:hypothetical protein [Candidatus Omnitrophota bacterium]